MSQTPAPIPAGTQIVDKLGAITVFFRLRWEEVRAAFGVVPDLASLPESANKTAAIVTATAYVTKSSGLYRMSYYLRKTLADGVSSALTFTYGWTDHGTPLTEIEPTLNTDTPAAQQSGSKLVYADAETELTYAVAYASNTPNKMTYELEGPTVEFLG
jgi:hypothetical protein